MTDLKPRSMRTAQSHAMDIAEEARLRGWTAADVFGAFAQIVAGRNPQLARLSLDALETVVRAKMPVLAKGEASPVDLPRPNAVGGAAGYLNFTTPETSH